MGDCLSPATIGRLRASVFETRTATGGELFPPFNLSSHNHVYIAKYLPH